MKALARTLVALFFDAIFVAVILVALAALQYLFSLLPLSGPLTLYLTTIHEWTTLAVFAIFVLKAVLRLLLSTSEQVDELTKSLKYETSRQTEVPEKKNAT